MRNIATLSGNAIHSCVIAQEQPATAHDARATGELSVRRVTQRPEAVQIESRILKHHTRRTDHASVSFLLSETAARHLAGTLIGANLADVVGDLSAFASDYVHGLKPDVARLQKIISTLGGA